MAIAFAQVSLHSRSQGHSAVAGAAYRAGEHLKDDRTGETHYFNNRSDVIYAKVLLPEGADAKFLNRSLLWNEVEKCEKRKDAQLAKDIVLALPKELTPDQWIELTEQFAHAHFVSKGVVADIAIHYDGEANPHAHLYTTTRRLLGDRFDQYKARDLNPAFAKGFVLEKDLWGEKWRDLQNHYFLEKGIDLVVDQNQMVAGRHEGRWYGKGEHHLKTENQLRKAASVEIALNNPQKLLLVLAQKQAVFSDRDMEKWVFKNTDNLEQYQRVLTKLKGAKDLIALGVGQDGRMRYTTRSTYQLECRLADDAQELFAAQTKPLSAKQVEKMAKEFGLTLEQTSGLYHLTDSNKIAALVGRAGAGKTYLMKPAGEIWQREGLTVTGLAVAGIAAKGLEREANIPSMTIASFKKRFKDGYLGLTHKDILVLDEAGMVDLHDMAFLVKAAKQSGAKLILMGDHDQLQPIGPGAPFRALLERIGFCELGQIMRQEKEGDRQASIALSKGNIDQALTYYDSKIHLLADADQARIALIQDWQQTISLENLSRRIIIAHQNLEVDEANKAARAILLERGILAQQSQTIQTAYGELALTPGDQILCRRNNSRLGLHNGDFAQVISINGDDITVQLRTKQVIFNAKQYQTFSYGYAATVHKTQGATFDHVYVSMGSKWWNRHLTYVALTRHRKEVSVYADQSHYADKAMLAKELSRFSFVDTVLDFPLSFALRRGFDPEKLIGRCIEKLGAIKEKIHHQWLFVRNYEAYLQQQRHNKRQQFAQKERQEAIRVAHFVDLYRGVGQLFGQSKNPDYKLIYQATMLKNELAFEINKDLPTYQKALVANHILAEVIQQAAEKHQNKSVFEKSTEDEKDKKDKKAQKADIDWFDKKYEKEWAKLQMLPPKQNDKLSFLLKFYELGKAKLNDKSFIVKTNHAITETIKSLSQTDYQLIQTKSAKLGRVLEVQREVARDRERDR